MITPERIRELIGDPDRELGKKQQRALKARERGLICHYCGDVPALPQRPYCRDCENDLS